MSSVSISVTSFTDPLEIIALVCSTGLSQEWQGKMYRVVMCVRNSADVTFSIIMKIFMHRNAFFSEESEKSNWVLFNEIVEYSMMEKIDTKSQHHENVT